jgi:hypothetical protein
VTEISGTGSGGGASGTDPIVLAGDSRLGAAPTLSIAVRGVPHVRLGDSDVRFATRHAQLALYLLTIAGPEGIPTEEMIDTLWHGVVPRRAAASVRTMLWQIRRGLDHEAWRLRRSRGIVLFDVDGVRLDFEPGTQLRRDQILTGWAFRIPPAIQPLLIVAA